MIHVDDKSLFNVLPLGCYFNMIMMMMLLSQQYQTYDLVIPNKSRMPLKSSAICFHATVIHMSGQHCEYDNHQAGHVGCCILFNESVQKKKPKVCNLFKGIFVLGELEVLIYESLYSCCTEKCTGFYLLSSQNLHHPIHFKVTISELPVLGQIGQ